MTTALQRYDESPARLSDPLPPVDSAEFWRDTRLLTLDPALEFAFPLHKTLTDKAMAGEYDDLQSAVLRVLTGEPLRLEEAIELSDVVAAWEDHVPPLPPTATQQLDHLPAEARDELRQLRGQLHQLLRFDNFGMQASWEDACRAIRECDVPLAILGGKSLLADEFMYRHALGCLRLLQTKENRTILEAAKWPEKEIAAAWNVDGSGHFLRGLALLTHVGVQGLREACRRLDGTIEHFVNHAVFGRMGEDHGLFSGDPSTTRKYVTHLNHHIRFELGAYAKRGAEIVKAIDGYIAAGGEAAQALYRNIALRECVFSLLYKQAVMDKHLPSRRQIAAIAEDLHTVAIKGGIDAQRLSRFLHHYAVVHTEDALDTAGALGKMAKAVAANIQGLDKYFATLECHMERQMAGDPKAVSIRGYYTELKVALALRHTTPPEKKICLNYDPSRRRPYDIGIVNEVGFEVKTSWTAILMRDKDSPGGTESCQIVRFCLSCKEDNIAARVVVVDPHLTTKTEADIAAYLSRANQYLEGGLPEFYTIDVNGVGLRRLNIPQPRQRAPQHS